MPAVSAKEDNLSARIPISLQLYSVRDDAARDLPGVLQAVARMGYEGVEFAGFYGHDAPTVKQMLDDAGLPICGAHVGLDLLLGDKFDETVAFHQTLGNRYLIVPGLAEKYRNSREAWRRTADLMNDLAERLRPLGMRTGYHNHTVEFEPMDGELPWDTFFGNTDPSVIMQFDTGNALHGGADALPFLQRYPGRAVTVHLKPHSATNPQALIGEDDIPWPELFAVCESSGGTEWYIVEYEVPGIPPLEAVDRCLQALRGMGK